MLRVAFFDSARSIFLKALSIIIGTLSFDFISADNFFKIEPDPIIKLCYINIFKIGLKSFQK